MGGENGVLEAVEGVEKGCWGAGPPNPDGVKGC